jgi:hypothetical protein
MPRAKVYRGLQLTIGPIRILVSNVHSNGTAEVHVIFNNEMTLGVGQTCPVESIEKLIDWHESIAAFSLLSDGVAK